MTYNGVKDIEMLYHGVGVIHPQEIQFFSKENFVFQGHTLIQSPFIHNALVVASPETLSNTKFESHS
jgi:hypothetical protein